MFEWLSLDEAASAIADATGEGVQPGSLLREAFSGSLAVCAVIPNWTAPGGGELVFYTADGGRIGSATDGVFRHLSKYDFQALQTHKRLTLAGRRVELPNAATGGVIEAFIGPDAPTIGIDDLRVSAAEIQRFISSRSEVEANDTALPRRAKHATERTLDMGVSKAEILAVFTNPIPGQTEEQWKKMLGDVPGWLKKARIDAGGRSIQSRWNPAELAGRLHEKGYMGRGTLGSLIRRHFPEYVPEWEAYAGSFYPQ